MGYFAILKSSESSSDFSLPRCHVNVWLLPSALPGRHLLYFDVGFEVQASQAPVDGVEILLPFRLEEGYKRDHFQNCQDLFNEVIHDRSSELIFGGTVKSLGGSSTSGHKLDIGGGEELTAARIDTGSSGPVSSAEFSASSDSSLFRIKFVSQVPHGESRYFRIRFRVFGSRPLWKSKGYLSGAYLDFRISDVRESKHVDHEVALRDRIIPIGRVYFFLMAPEYYQLANCSPQIRYVRVLERHAWRDYLRAASHRRGSVGYLVYYWRSSATAIDSDNPFRTFSDFNRTATHSRWMSLLWFAVAIFIAIGAVRFSSDFFSDLTWDKIKDMKGVLGFLGFLTVTGILSAFRGIRKTVANRALGPRRAFRRAERVALR